jgi:predicted restriction endonuclease
MEKYSLSHVARMRVSDQELINDLVRVAGILGKGSVSCPKYKEHGSYSHTTQSLRFGSWNKAIEAAGLAITHDAVSEEQLFENLLRLWEHYGRQPRRRELGIAPSTISQSPYTLRFGSWTAALKAFITFANASDTALRDSDTTHPRRKTPRDPSLRLRWKVLQRDNFRCRGCGRIPSETPGTHLHVDHVEPWSAGGETLLENLQTLCQDCNLGKGDL